MKKTITTLTAAALAAAGLALGTTPAHALDAPQQMSQHFAFVSAEQDWTVPAGVWAVTIGAAGGAGGHGDNLAASGSAGANGGYGALVTETLFVKPGDVLTFSTGGAGGGAGGPGEGTGAGDIGGFGSSSDTENSGVQEGGGGGGAATEVSYNGHLEIVAGGGGGGGGGGAVVGESGGQGGDAGHDGQAGTGAGAGAAGLGRLTGTATTQHGQSSSPDAALRTSAGGGGGGGAGWDGTTTTGGIAGSAGGSGGGGGGGGAGGASYASVPGTAVGLAPARGDGYVDLSWTQGITTTTSLAAAPTALAGSTDTLTATVALDHTDGQLPPTGTVTFLDSAPGATTPTTLGTVPVDAHGVATWNATGLVLGTHGFRAVYNGDNYTVGSSSSFVYQTVTSKPVVPTFSANPLAFGATTVNSTRSLTVFATNLSQTPIGAPAFSFGSTAQVDTNHSTCFTSAALAPNAACTWVITYTPTTLGEDDASIAFYYGAAGTVTLAVTGSGVVARPMVTAISPTSGPAKGGTLVTITGHNLAAATKITAGGVRLTSVQCTGSTKCTGRTPAGRGTVDLRVTTAAGTSPVSTVDRFTYTS